MSWSKLLYPQVCKSSQLNLPSSGFYRPLWGPPNPHSAKLDSAEKLFLILSRFGEKVARVEVGVGGGVGVSGVGGDVGSHWRWWWWWMRITWSVPITCD